MTTVNIGVSFLAGVPSSLTKRDSLAVRRPAAPRPPSGSCGTTAALTEFFGSGAGLSASVITRLTKQWQDERAACARRDLSGVDYVYVWADGIVRHEAPFDRVGWKDPPVA